MGNETICTIKIDDRTTTTLDVVNRKVEGVKGKVKELGKATEETQKVMVGRFSGIVGSATNVGLKVTAITEGFSKLSSVLSQPLAKAGQFETMQMSLEVLLGSTEKAKDRFRELSDFTKGTTFEVGQVVQASNELQSLGKYSKETLTMLSNLAIGSGKGLDQITDAYVALARGKKDQAMDLFSGIGITIEDFTKATGKGIDANTGMLQASAQEMMDALGQIVKDRNFEGLVEKQANTFEGMMGNLTASWDQFIGEVGAIVMPAVKEVIQGLSVALEFLREIVDSLAPYIKSLTTVVISAAAAFGGWQLGAKLLTATLFKDLGTAITTKVIPAIKAKIAVIKSATTETVQLSTTLKVKLMGAVKSVGTGVMGIIKGIGVGFKGLWGIIAANPIGAILVGITAIIGIVNAWQSAQDAKLEKEVEVSRIQLESLNTQKEKIETDKKEMESTKALLDEYSQLADKIENTGEEKERLTYIAGKLNEEYPGLNINTNNFKESLTEVRKEATNAATEIDGYTKSIIELDKQATETEKKFLAKSTDLAKEQVLKSAVKGTNFWVSRSDVDRDLMKEFYDVYHAQTEAEVEAARRAMLDSFIELDYLTAEGITEGKEAIEEFIKKRKEQLGLLKEEVEKTPDPPKLYNPEEFKEESDNLLKDYKKVVADVEEESKRLGIAFNPDHESFKEVRGKIMDLLKQTSGLDSKTIQGTRTTFGLDKPKETKTKTTQEKDNTFEYYKFLYETEKIAAEDYSNKINELIKKVADNKEYQKLSAMSVDNLTQAQRSKIMGFEKELQTYNKTLEDCNKKLQDTEKKHWENIVKNRKEGEELLQMYREIGIVNEEGYRKALENQMSMLEDSELETLAKRLKKGEKLNEEEIKAVQSYIAIKKGLFNQISDINTKEAAMKMGEFSHALNSKQEAFSSGKLPLEDYRKFLSNQIGELTGMFDEKIADEKFGESYAKVFEKLQDGSLTQTWLNAEIELLKQGGDTQAEALSGLLTNLENYKKEDQRVKNELTEQQQFFGAAMTASMGALSKGMEEAFASGFGKEGFKKLSQNMFEGFKMILNQTLDYLERMLILGSAKSLIEAFMNPLGLIKDIPLMIAAEIGLQTAKAAINSWTPKFALGGGVTAPTYALLGENYKKEYVISPEQMKNEVRHLLKNEIKYYYNPQQAKQVVEVNFNTTQNNEGIIKITPQQIYKANRVQEKIQEQRKF